MPSLSVFDFHGEDINFKRIYEKMKKYSIPYLEMIVYIGDKERIMTRLCISLASEKAYNQRLNKLKRLIRGERTISVRTPSCASNSIYLLLMYLLISFLLNIYEVYIISDGK